VATTQQNASSSDHGGVDRVPSSSPPAPAADDDDDDLVHALNRENRALAERIRELLARLDLREDDDDDERPRLEARVSELAADAARRERRLQEQGCLISELTRKTEDDLNAIMELRQRLAEAQDEGKHPPQSAKDEQPQQESRRQPDGTEQKLKQQEKEELVGSVASLREEQREAALAVRSRTEEKQRLTRALWVMKEERDGLTGSLGTLKLEREQVTRAVCGLRDERDQLGRTLDALREERGWLAQALAELKVRRETATLESLRSVREGEGVQMTPASTLRRSQEDVEELVRSECYPNPDGEGELSLASVPSSGRLKREHAEGPETSHDASKEEREDLSRSLCRLEEERRRTEQSMADLKMEEEQVMLSIRSLKEERDALKAGMGAVAFHDKSQSEGRSQEQQLANRIHGEAAKTFSQVCRIQTYNGYILSFQLSVVHGV